VNSIGIEFVRISPGSFDMGSGAGEPGRAADEGSHRVTLTRPFYLATTKVSQRQWERVMGANPSHFRGPDLPVDQATWEEAAEFCRRLGAAEGRAYRLPTEAEWEYAARAGTTTPFGVGATIGSETANFDARVQSALSVGGEYRARTTPVAAFAQNAWGLRDMQGNLCEWCSDWYGAYADGPVVDPTGPVTGTERVCRGGSWDMIPRHCRAANRGKCPQGYRTYRIGVRVALDP
ncbi:MAG TPA: formylglycine-generating enzyme family protein, partial [Humisphaera sp.]